RACQRHARRRRGDLRLGARALAALADPARAQRRPATRERGPGERRGAAVRGRHGERHRGRPRGQGPREGRGLRGGGALDGGGGRRVSAVEHRFGPYGGQYVPETLMPALAELEEAWVAAWGDAGFRAELDG